MKAEEAFHRADRASAKAKIFRKRHKRGASLGEEGRQEILARSICKVKGPSIPFENVLRPLDDQSMEFTGRHSLGESGTETMEEIKDPFLFLVNFGRAQLELAHPLS
jgi:hypothetical protein